MARIRTKKKMTPGRIALCVVAVVLMLLWLFPYYYLVLQSVVPWQDVDKKVFTLDFSLESYQYLFGGNGAADPFQWLRALFNSFAVSVPTALITIVVGLMTGYAAVHMKYKGKGFIHSSLLFQMFFPVVVLLVPRYIIVSPLANHYLVMILPLAISIWGVFMYMNYFRTVPRTMFEAAKIDGASDLVILFRIAFPATESLSTIVFLSVFMTRWNELMWDMLIAPSVNMQTLNVMISTQFNQNSTLAGPMYAASVLLTLPLIILFLCFSKHFKEGINFMLK